MDATLKNIMTKVAAFWSRFSKRAKILIIGAVAVAAVLAVVLNIALNTTRYTQLFTGLSDSEAGQIVTQMKTLGVKYKIEGSTIYVDSAKADETRMTLAESGYPQSTLTYSIYTSGSTWADTDSDKKQKVLYQLQNRLQDTINTIPSISSSVVTIVENQNDTYVLSSDKITATASVKLNLRPGRTLTQNQVNGIVNLVASSVPDLSKDNVTVLDSDGTQLNQNSSNISDNTTQQLNLKSMVENEIKQKVLSVLKPVFGSTNVQVAAGATLDFSQTTTNKTTYSSPNGSVSGVGLPSSSSSAMTVTGDNSTASGVAGVNNGQPTYTTSSSSAGGTVTQANQQASYLYDTVNQQIQSQGGTMTGLTISVLLNSKSQSAAGIDTSAITQAVAFAVGMKDVSGISVELVPFLGSTTSSSVTPKTNSNTVLANPLVLMGAVGVLGVALIAGLLLFLLTRRKKHKKQKEAAAMAAAAAIPLPDGESPLMEPDAAVRSKTIEETIEEASSKNIVKKQIAQFADDKPELVAQILKNWLKD